jgi:hypothetical protein
MERVSVALLLYGVLRRAQRGLKRAGREGQMQPMSDFRRPPPVLDMTPEGEFREPPKPSGFDAFLARLGGFAVLIGVMAGGLILAALAIFFIGLLLPVVLGAAAVAALSIWWRRRRLRKMGIEPGSVRIVVRR